MQTTEDYVQARSRLETLAGGSKYGFWNQSPLICLGGEHQHTTARHRRRPCCCSSRRSWWRHWTTTVAAAVDAARSSSRSSSSLFSSAEDGGTPPRNRSFSDHRSIGAKVLPVYPANCCIGLVRVGVGEEHTAHVAIKPGSTAVDAHVLQAVQAPICKILMFVISTIHSLYSYPNISYCNRSTWTSGRRNLAH